MTGAPYALALEDLIVALPHLPQVRAQLEALNVRLSDPDTCEELGLARLPLADVGEAAGQILAGLAAADEASRRGTRPAPPMRPLDQVLWGLRGLFAADHAGWTPLLGKNRLVGRVHGAGEVSHGGGGTPEMISPPPNFPTRATGPGRGVRVGVLDTGLSPQPWLAGGWAGRFSDTDLDDGEPLFPEGHATFIAGLVLSQAPGATIEVRRVLTGDGTTDTWTAAQEIVRQGRSGIDVLNLSFVCYSDDGQPPMALSAAMDRLPPDLVVVAAAGNHGGLTADSGADTSEGSLRIEEQQRKPAWPAALDDVIAVGACTTDGRLADFSPDAPWVDLHAPGVGLRSTYLPRAKAGPGATVVSFGGYARWGGTSFAAALVSGAIAAGTDPGRVTSRAALEDILDSLKRSTAQTVAKTYAPFLKLRTL